MYMIQARVATTWDSSRSKMNFSVCSLLAILYLLLVGNVICQRPQTGILLWSSLTESPVPNNTMLTPGGTNEEGNITFDGGLGCFTARDTFHHQGNWFYPNGDLIYRRNAEAGVLYTADRNSNIELLDGNGPSFDSQELEGVYKCRIRDENNRFQNMYAGLYKTDNYYNSDGPLLPSPPSFQLLSSLTASPLSFSFSLTCTSTSFPPTVLTWSRDGQDLEEGEGQFQSSQILRNRITTTYNNVLTAQGSNLTGVYRCKVANDRGSREAEMIVRVPSGPPTNVTAALVGNNMIRVQWVPPENVSGYLILYTSNTSDVEYNDTVLNSDATEHVIKDVVVDQPTVQYTISILAYAELPGERNATVSVIFDTAKPPSLTDVEILSSTTARIHWVPPEGEDGIVGYVISFTPAIAACPGIEGGLQMVTGGTSTQALLKGLEEYTEYDITVMTQNPVGVGPPSNVWIAKTKADKPSGPPLLFSAEALNTAGSLRVEWSPPECIHLNSEKVTSYILQHGPAGASELEETSVTAGLAQTTNMSYVLDMRPTFTNYSVHVLAVNVEGRGPPSEPEVVALVDVPGAVETLSTEPDILSVVVLWQPPKEAQGWITKYHISYRLASSSSEDLINTVEVDSWATSYWITGLPRLTTFVFSVRPFTVKGGGSSSSVMGTTEQIGQVTDVKVTAVNSTAVEVSWMRLQSNDVSFYRVTYSQAGSDGKNKRQNAGEIHKLFPSESSSGVVEGLVEGKQYEFKVAAGVNDSGTLVYGPSSPTALALLGDEEDSDSDVPVGAIVGGAIAAAIVIAAVVVVCIVSIYLYWKRSHSGKLSFSHSVEMKPRNSPLPLPDFDEQPGLASCKPIIEECPQDTIALEGERVTFQPKVSGTPPPSICWYHSGSMVMPNYAIELSDSGAVTFICVEPHHAGSYRYTVSNSVGSVQGQVTLFVQSESGEQTVKDQGVLVLDSMPVALEEFGSYVSDQHANSDRGFRDQFLTLDTGEDGQTKSVGSMPNNRVRNRFLNIHVYDGNRIKLVPIPGRPDCQHDYINASYIDGYFIPKKFVATQGPVEKSLVDFWRLVWRLHPPTIAMITNVMEGSRPKCEQYWPEVGTEEYGPFKVTLAEQEFFADYTIRTLLVSLTTRFQNPLKVTQYHFTSWPDHGVPDYATPMLAYHRRIKAEHRPVKGPLLVHCSAGVGRSGTFITMDIALQQAENEGVVNIPAIISKIRRQRMKMVQTAEQYVFIHDAVLEKITCGDTQIPPADLHSTIQSMARRDSNTELTDFQAQFHVLEQVTPKASEAMCPTAHQYPERSRKMDYLPTDRWRVVLKAEHPDYICASFANGYKHKKAFILAQGPMTSTCRDFWKMVYERNCGVIVMLTGIIEDDEEVCCRYWPVQGAEQYGEFAVRPLEETLHEGFVERIFSVTDSKSGQTHKVTQFQLLNWEPNGQTSKPSSVVAAINCTMNAQRRAANSPVVVHCSDTVSRSGVFCATMTIIEALKTEGMVDVFQVVKALRIQKPGAVPTVELYRLIHDLVLMFVESFSTYSNFK